MAVFENKFLTKAGQKERLSNVLGTLKASVTGKGVQANTKSKVVNKVLSTAASNPFSTALVGAVAVNPSVALAAVKTAPKTTIGLSIAAPIITSAAVSNPALAKKAVSGASGFQKDLTNFGGNLASIKSFSDAGRTIQENPILSGAAIVGAGLAVKGGVSAISTAINTGAIRENTQITKENIKNMGVASPPVTDYASGNIIPTKEASRSTSPTGAASSTPQPSSSAAPVNIQQNNYFGDDLSEKYINKRANKA